MEHLFHKGLPIPQIEVFPDRKWFHIAGVRGWERRLQREFKTREIKYYLPRTRSKNEAGLIVAKGLLFPGNIFAVFTSRVDISWIGEFVPEYKVTKPKQPDLLGDLRFMKLMERLNGEYPFQWEQSLPKAQKTIILHDNTGCGWMQVEFYADSVKLWFSFFHGCKILSFTMTQAQFSSLQT